ncbi:MAG: hypothetical protein ACOYBO_13290 [Azonexus sp.]
MKLSRSIVMLLLVGLLALLIAPIAHADGPTPPTPQPPVVVTPPPPIDPLAAAKAIDAANAERDKWEAVARSTVANVQASINSAYGALAAAQSSVYQLQISFQQSEAARIAAQQGQINQAIEAARLANVSAANAMSLLGQSQQSASEAIRQANQAARDVLALRAELSMKDQQLQSAQQTNTALSKTNAAQAYRLAQLEPYALDTYHHAMAAWVLSAVLGLVLIAVLLMLVIVFAVERRNRWPRFKAGIDSALIVPVSKQ